MYIVDSYMNHVLCFDVQETHLIDDGAKPRLVEAEGILILASSVNSDVVMGLEYWNCEAFIFASVSVSSIVIFNDLDVSYWVTVYFLDFTVAVAVT